MIRVVFAEVIGDLAAAVTHIIMTLPMIRSSFVHHCSHPVGCLVYPAVGATQPACPTAFGTRAVLSTREWKRFLGRQTHWT